MTENIVLSEIILCVKERFYGVAYGFAPLVETTLDNQFEENFIAAKLCA